MTEQEIAELRELRNMDQLLKEKINMIEAEIMDVDIRMNYFKRTRHGKGLGLFISLICFGLSIAGLISYLLLFLDSSGENMNDYAAAITFSVTATMIPFLLIFVLIFGLTTMVLSLILIVELFPSEGAYRSAVIWRRVNIPHEKKMCLLRREELEQSLGELKRERYDLQDRLEELKELERKMLWG